MGMSREDILRHLQESDQFGLLKRRAVEKPTSEQIPLVNAFEEIVAFYEEHGRLPDCNKESLREFQLYHRYNAICRDMGKLSFLQRYDLNNILEDKTGDVATIDRLQKEDVHGLLAAEPLEIFKLKHIQERLTPEYISRRKFCHDFIKHETRFKEIADDLRSRRRKLVNYTSDFLQPGRFYVLGGIILYLESVDGNSEEYDYKSGSRVRFDGRTTIIFDNGTTSDMLFRSLDKALQKDGFAISERSVTDKENVSISNDDVQNGYIYILRTKNNNLTKYKNLYKIGCTAGAVNERIKNAVKEPTYLFSEVEVVSALRCYNIVPEELEDKMHSFFDSQRLNTEIYDKDNHLFRPREWFVVNIDSIKEAVKLILEGVQDDYYYNPTIQQIVKK